jgi:hypothetical protein
MSGRHALHVSGLLLTGMLTTAGCGGETGDVPKSAPGANSRGTTAVSPSQGTPTEDIAETKLQEARRALQAFMRRSTVGDTSVCGYVAPKGDFERRALKGDCLKSVKDMPHFIKPDERRALVTVKVSGGTVAANGEVSIRFADLSWSDGNMTVYTVQPVFVMREIEGTWKIVR